jgi:hypothetical protein
MASWLMSCVFQFQMLQPQVTHSNNSFSWFMLRDRWAVLPVFDLNLNELEVLHVERDSETAITEGMCHKTCALLMLIISNFRQRIGRIQPIGRY